MFGSEAVILCKFGFGIESCGTFAWGRAGLEVLLVE